MALTIDILKAEKTLEGLSDVQLNAIATLSANDEVTVIGSKIGTLHGQYDTDVLSVSGIAKNQGEKSYDYTKRVIASLKEKAASLDTLTADVTSLKAEKQALEDKIKAGSTDAVLKQALQDATTKLVQLQQLYDTDKQTYEADKVKFQDSLHQTHVEYAIDKELSTLKFKASIPETVKKILLTNAKTELLTTVVPDFVEANGEKKLVFRDKQGNLLNNQANQLNPFSAAELAAKNMVDVLDLGKVQPGAGTKQNMVIPGQSGMDLSGAKNQVIATNMIREYLGKQGLVAGSEEFTAEQTKIWNENGIQQLPIE